ncbi:MAG: serine/threonine-protein kinase [Actinoplanes sp.]
MDDRIATGGMGDVWRGTDVVLGRVVAVKVLRAQMLADAEFAARFYGEARMMAAFRHPGVVEVYDYAGADDSDDEQVAYLVMAYVEGEPLSTRVKQGPMSVTETMSIVAQAAEALHAAHKAGTVHRDVKPGNLIVKPNGTVVLVDFGVARSPAVTSVTALNAIVGTALYMAPEQVAKGNVSAATDIYALGAVAYHCIAGKPPFDGDNALQVALRHLEDEPEPLPDHVPLAVVDLIAKAMAKQPADRFQSAAEFAEAALEASGPMDWKKLTGTSLVAPLSPAAPTQTVPAPRGLPFSPSPAPMAPPKRAQRSQTALMVAVIGLLVLAVGLGVAISMSDGDDKRTVEGTQTSGPAVEQTQEDTFAPVEPTETTHAPNKPGVISRRPTAPQSSASASRSSGAPASSATPTVRPTSKPPVTPSSTPPSTTPTTTTPAPDPTTTTPAVENNGG